MKLLIHDLDDKEWEKVADSYKGYEVISDNGTIKPCVGCFGCWLKTPGKCLIDDGYGRMGELIHKASEVVVISRYTYGGFSSFVKNVFDRSIGIVLPFMYLRDGEMHHKKRYEEEKEISFIFRKSSFTEEEKAHARQYVEAVCRNFHGIIKKVEFEQCIESKTVNLFERQSEYGGKTVLINGSLRGDNANSRKFMDRLSGKLGDCAVSFNLLSYLNKYEELAQIVSSADKVVFVMPLYVDGIPSQVLRLMEMLEKSGKDPDKKIYCIANMGFYESHQIRNLLSMVKEWADKSGFTYCGGLAIGAGEMVGSMMRMSDPSKGPARNVTLGIDEVARAIKGGTSISDIYADAYKFPRFLYMLAANLGWPKGAKANGIKPKDLYRRCD